MCIRDRHLAGYIISRLTSGKAGGREQLDSNVVQLNYRSKSVNDAMTVVKAILLAYKDHLDVQFKLVNKRTVDLVTQVRGERKTEYEKLDDEILRLQNSTRTEVRVGMETNTTAAEDDWKKQHEELRLLAGKKVNISSLIESIEKDKDAGEDIEALLVRVESAGTLKRERPADAKQAMEDLLFPRLLQHQEALFKYGPNHPRVKEIELQIRAITEYMEGRMLTYEANQQNQVTPEQHLDRYLHVLRSELRQLEAATVKLEAQHALTDQLVQSLAAEKDNSGS